MMPGIGDPDDDHPNPVGDAVVNGARAVLERLGPLGRKVAAQLPERDRHGGQHSDRPRES